MEESQIAKFSNAMIVPLHKITNGGDLLEPTYEITTIKATKCSLYRADPNPNPNNMLLDFKIHVNKSKHWKSISVDKCPTKILGRIKEPALSHSFSVPNCHFFTSDRDRCLAQLHDEISSANIVRTQFCDILSARIADSASQILHAILEVYKEPRCFLVEVEVETVTTVEYQEQQHRGRKRKGINSQSCLSSES